MEYFLEYLSLYALLFIFFQIIFPLCVSYKKTGIKAGTIAYFPIAVIIMLVLLFFVEGPIISKIVFYLVIIVWEIIYFLLILSPLIRLLDTILIRFHNKMINRGLFK